ncbi:MAG: DEAD/DEAH box helicase, partial [Candidatus Omnitrophota bacterium]
MSEGAVPTDLQFLKGVGPKRVKVFEQVGIRTIRDLLYLFPRRYEDRSQFTPIADVQPASVVTLRGEVLSCTLKRLRSMTLLEASVGDETGVVRAVWFNQPYLKNQLVPGTQIILYGKADLHQGHLKLASPEYEIAEADADPVHALRITPVYPLTEGLFQRSLRKTLYDAVKTHLDRSVEEYLPEPVRRRYRLMELREAVRQMHIPVSFESQLEARKRVVFDEFLLFEVLLFQRIEAMRTASRSYPVAAAPAEAEIFEKALPFTLTESQRAAVATILRDMARAWPMNRLLQGDVGSGKTVVAAAAMAAVAQSGHQAAMLVPTEILAEQHYKTLTRLLEPCGIRPALLTSSTGADKRARILAELKQGKLRVLAGTHSILREDVRFLKLALV